LYQHREFGPLVFWDLSWGATAMVGTSLVNEAEARVCVHIYRAIRGRLKHLAVSPLTRAPVSVAVITPYKEQRDLLARQFARFRDAGLEVNTVDAFQGKEVDLVVFSCVRAGHQSGIGFLDDCRRLNVALTRARFALLVVGDARALHAKSAMWRGFVLHVRAAGFVFPVPEAQLED
jgi:senataxin